MARQGRWNAAWASAWSYVAGCDVLALVATVHALAGHSTASGAASSLNNDTPHRPPHDWRPTR